LGGATINGGGAKIMIASNHTIANGILTECELAMQKGVSNIVIRNMKISFNDQCSDKDLIHLETAVTNVWVDHCELFDDTTHGKDYYDGALDITHGCDNITVTNVYAHDHYKVSLVGHSDSNGSEDTGKLHVTYANNWFDNIDARSPLLRFGTAHIFNNYMSNYFDAATGCNIRMGAKARIEGNVFENCANPILSVDSNSIGYWDLGPASVDTNTYTGATWATGSPASSSQTNASLNGFADTCSYNPPYSYTLQSASAVKAYVQANAGYGKVDGTVY
jgi:pectate lyase